MKMTVIGRIKQKTVKNERVSLLVGETWISAFINAESKVPAEVKETLRELIVGDQAEFECVENVSKKTGTTYLNIVGVMRVKDVHDDIESPVRPDGKQERKVHGDAPDSMILSYAKDGAIKLLPEGSSSSTFLDYVEVIYKGMKKILAGETRD
jgi:hypothetical protein